MIKMTKSQYEAYQDEHAGYCTHCDEVTSEDGVEPDAQGYECSECGKETVMGIENALIYENIEITDEEDDDDTVPIISLADLEDEDL